MSTFSDKVEYEISIINNSKNEYYFTNDIDIFIHNDKTSYYPYYICSICNHKFNFNRCQCYYSDNKNSIIINNNIIKKLHSSYISKIVRLLVIN